MVAQLEGWTYGAEHELGDWDQGLLPNLRQLRSGWQMDRRDVTIVNSNGIAADPKGKLYRYGGELNSPPTHSIERQCEDFRRAMWLLADNGPAPVVNYRSNLHIHIRVPGLKEDLGALKRIARFNLRFLKHVLPRLEPIPNPHYQKDGGVPFCLDRDPGPAEFKGAVRRWRRRLVSHHTTLGVNRAWKQLDAATVDDFFAAECSATPHGKVQWHLSPRCAINLRQLMQTDTIEFRHFPGTLNPAELRSALVWCADYLTLALAENEGLDPVLHLQEKFQRRPDLFPFPQFPLYCHWQEVNYRRTVHDGTVSKDAIADNIKTILENLY